jgi:hypothetical protein
MTVRGGAPGLTGVTFLDNTVEFKTGFKSGRGGGLAVDRGRVTVVDTTFADNFAGGDGGGLDVAGGDVTLLNVTFSANGSGFGGRAVHSGGGRTVLTYPTLSDHSPRRFGALSVTGTARLVTRETILNKAPRLAGSPAVTFRGRNLVIGGCPADTTCNPTRVIDAAPRLAGLADNGGMVPTIALRSGSPAIDAGTPGICATVPADARGIVRPQEGDGRAPPRCDLGAFELVPVA